MKKWSKQHGKSPMKVTVNSLTEAEAPQEYEETEDLMELLQFSCQEASDGCGPCLPSDEDDEPLLAPKCPFPWNCQDVECRNSFKPIADSDDDDEEQVVQALQAMAHRVQRGPKL